MSDRTTVIVGAGLPLNLSLPEYIMVPSTYNITQKVCLEPYPFYSLNPIDRRKTTDVVKQFYLLLKNNYPVRWNNNEDINFEQVFHCMEMYSSYLHSWQNNCQNEKLCPVFGPFTAPSILFDPQIFYSIPNEFLLRIMEIVNDYDQYFKNHRNSNEKWLTDFFLSLSPSDVFTFNYDTMFETIYGEGNYEDGFEVNPKFQYKTFNPKNIIDNPKNLSTINHLHGCIEYGHIKDHNALVKEFNSHDWVKYPDYDTSSKWMRGHYQSQPYSQSGETIINGPILTGLDKLNKLNCIPFDFYHSNLVNSICKNNKLLIIGYGFGDLYCNQLIQRMNLIHKDAARVCVIDYWTPPYSDNQKFDITENMKQDFGYSLCIYADKNNFGDVTEEILSSPSLTKFNSGRLIVSVTGLKDAARYKSDIINFLNS